MIHKTDKEVVDYILQQCAADPENVFSIGDLIHLCLDDEDRDIDIGGLSLRIVEVLRADALARIIDDGQRVMANSMTIEINEKGGYIGYAARLEEKIDLLERATAAQNRTIIKNEWRSEIAFVISILAIIISAVALFIKLKHNCND